MTTEDDSAHAREARRRQLAIARGLTPAQRLAQAERMNRSMRELLAAGFRARHPEWDEPAVRRAVADRILHARTG
jgi:hypothetical protein